MDEPKLKNMLRRAVVALSIVRRGTATLDGRVYYLVGPVAPCAVDHDIRCNVWTRIDGGEWKILPIVANECRTYAKIMDADVHYTRALYRRSAAWFDIATPLAVVGASAMELNIMYNGGNFDFAIPLVAFSAYAATRVACTWGSNIHSQRMAVYAALGRDSCGRARPGNSKFGALGVAIFGSFAIGAGSMYACISNYYRIDKREANRWV